jgi:5'-nucleotidase
MVFAGINHGGNLGDDVLYSGTVAAATEGRFLGLPAVAISLAGGSEQVTHFETAAHVAVTLLKQLIDKPLPQDTILNVNVPDIAIKDLKGYQATRLGQRHKSEPVITGKDPRGRLLYWVGPPGAEQDAGSGTDFYAISAGYVSVTPLQLDLTWYSRIEELSTWLPKEHKL